MSYIQPIIALNILMSVLGTTLAVADRFLRDYEPCEVDVNDGEEEFQINGGDSLLRSLAENEIFIPSACGGQGSCGYCKVRVLEGGGPVLPTEEPVLTREELLDRHRLACQVKVREDMEIELPAEWLAIEEYEAIVASTKELTSTIKEIVFDLKEPETIDFTPGQYVQVKIPTKSGYENRAYSIASTSDITDRIMLNVRRVEGGLGSTYLHSLEQGEKVELTGPYGDFVLQEDSEKDAIFVAGGVGLAPLRSMILSALESHPDRQFYLFYGAHTKEDLYYQDELNEASRQYDNFNFVPALDAPDPDWDGEVGLITDVLDSSLSGDQEMEGYLCGPPPMMDAAIEVLRGKGVSKEDIYFDDFSS